MDRKVKILVVDDVASARKIVRRLLERSGFDNIFESKDGQEALDLLKKDSFNLVISDWDMPQMSGIDLLHAVRATKSLDKLPFIMITSAAERDLVIKAGAGGVSSYLVKPFSAEILVSRVEGVLVGAATEIKPPQ